MKSKFLSKLFEGRNVIVEVDEHVILWFEIESLSMAIGYITKAKGKEYLRKQLRKDGYYNTEVA